jgi:DNA modification methylase
MPIPLHPRCHALLPRPRPYYEDAHVSLYCGDCLQLLPLLPLCDALLTDPPYGIGLAKQGTVGTHRTPRSRRRGFNIRRCTQFRPVDWDDDPPPLWLMQMAMSRARWSIVWGGGHIGSMPRATCWLIWDKRNDGMSFGQAEIAWTNLRRSMRMFRWRWNGCLQEDMKRKEKRLHPAQKPVPLLEWCLSFLPGANSVLDPFAGAGSTLVAARRRGMRAIGIERSPHYCEIAARRLAANA